MKQEWFSSTELAKIDGLPSTTQGVNRKARVENWQCRKRSGVQGKAVEYHIDSLPSFAKSVLRAQENIATYIITPVEPLQLWITAFQQLTDNEKSILSSWLMKNGVTNLVQFIEQQEKVKEN